MRVHTTSVGQHMYLPTNTRGDKICCQRQKQLRDNGHNIDRELAEAQVCISDADACTCTVSQTLDVNCVSGRFHDTVLLNSGPATIS